MLYFFSFIPRTITYGLSYGTKTRVAQRFSIPSPTYCLSRSRPIVQRLHSILYSKRRYKELLCIQDISFVPESSEVCSHPFSTCVPSPHCLRSQALLLVSTSPHHRFRPCLARHCLKSIHRVTASSRGFTLCGPH